MANRRKPIPELTNPRTVTMTGPNGQTDKVTPEAANALEANGWIRDKALGNEDRAVEAAVTRATEPLLRRIADLEADLAKTYEATPIPPVGDQLPASANDLIAWIGNDPQRATTAQTAEAARPQPRATVTEHIGSVLNKSKED